MSVFVIDERYQEEVLRYCWSLNGEGYVCSKVGGRRVTLHRYVWSFAHNGDVPAMLDHINGDKLDCRIENLRPATGSLNCRSRLRSSGGRLPEGVQPKPGPLPYFAHICLWRCTLYLGSFADIEAASAAYEKARRIMLAVEAERAKNCIGQPMPPPPRSAAKKSWNQGWRGIFASHDEPRAISRGVRFANSFVQEAVA
jgi:hypothetical protein